MVMAARFRRIARAVFRRIPSSSVGRNSETMPAQLNVDVRIEQACSHVRGRAAMDVIREAFNVFNRSNFSEVNNIFGSGAYPSRARA